MMVRKVSRKNILKTGLLLLICLTTNLSIFSQETSTTGDTVDTVSEEYPKLVYYEGDTLVLITLDQVDSLNITYSRLDECKELNKMLESLIQDYDVVISKDKELIKNLQKQIENKDNIIKEKGKIVEEKDKNILKKDKKIERLKKINTVLMAISGALAIALTIVSL